MLIKEMLADAREYNKNFALLQDRPSLWTVAVDPREIRFLSFVARVYILSSGIETE